MSFREPGKVLRDILISEMDLTPGQVMFTNQKFEIPTVGLYIVLSYLGPSRVISRMSELGDDGFGSVLEVQTMAVLYAMQLEIMAYNDPEGGNQARARKEEIQMAVSSIYSQQQQELNAMQIARHAAPFSDTSFLEETEMMTRYTTILMASAVLRKQKLTNDYYSDFQRAVPPQLVVNA